MDRNPVLVVKEGALKGQAFEITEEGLLVGRGESCQVRLPDAGVSREHCRVFIHNSAIWVQDMGSRNGAMVNGKRLTRPKSIGSSDTLEVASHRFGISLDRPTAPTPEVAPIVVEEGPTRMDVGLASAPTVITGPGFDDEAEPTEAQSNPSRPAWVVPVAVLVGAVVLAGVAALVLRG